MDGDQNQQSSGITTDDLYGGSIAPSIPTTESIPSQQQSPESPLPIEETPEIPINQPISEPVSSFQSTPVSMPSEPELPSPLDRPELSSQPPATPSGRRSGLFGNLLFFIVLFFVGIGLSLILRRYMSEGFGNLFSAAATPTPVPVAVVTQPSDPYEGWISYEVTSGATKLAILGISFKLPGDVLSPLCDGASCASQGTYLPGGSRFTVAARGIGQALTDFRAKLITDVAGHQFVQKDTTVAGRPAVEFTGTFTGKTVGGYSFTQMRGVMIEVTDSLSLEMNHFTPIGISSDFAADDAMFDKIVGSLEFGASLTAPKASPTLPAVSPTLPSEITPVATSSGY